MIKKYELTLDTHVLSDKPLISKIAISESDINSIQFHFTIQENGSAFDLSDKTIRIGIKKPSDLVVSQPCSITDSVNGKCEVLLLTTSYNEIGKYLAEIYIDHLDGSTIVTNKFYFQVVSSIL